MAHPTRSAGSKPRGLRPERGSATFKYVGIVFLMLLVLVPFMWVLVGSLKPTTALGLDQASAMVSSIFTVDNYVRLFSEYDFGQYFLNSLVVSGVTALFATSCAASAGYALAKFHFPGRSIAAFGILLTQMLPLVAVLIPMFIWMRSLGLVDSRWSLLIAYNAFAIPFGAWMLRGVFSALPKELEESARIDGANEFSIFLRIIVPVARAGLFATGVFAFILAWQEFLFAMTFLHSEAKYTLTVGIASLFGKEVIDLGLLYSAIIVTTIPVAVMFAFLQRHLVQGLTAGAVKG